MNNQVLQSSAASLQPALVPTAAQPAPAPGSFFARVQRIFSRSVPTAAQELYADLAGEADDFLEYHNPMLSIRGYTEAGE